MKLESLRKSDIEGLRSMGFNVLSYEGPHCGWTWTKLSDVKREERSKRSLGEKKNTVCEQLVKG